MPEYVIIGSSIAGLSAAEAIRERDAHSSITLVSDEPHRFYSRPGLAYVLRNDIPEAQLNARTPDDYRQLNACIVTARAERVLPDRRQVQLSNGEMLTYDRLLLATGSVAVSPDFPGHDLHGVVKLDSLDDLRHIAKLSGRRKTAVVIGGGITALELVEGLRARGMSVHYLMRNARYWPNVLDEVESQLVEDRLRAEGVVIHARTYLKQAIGKRGKLIGVETTAGEKIDCTVLAVAIGVRPRLELAQAAGLKIERGIVVDEYLRTSVPQIFAAGDVAQVIDPRTGRASLDVLWSTAHEQGRVAGINMAGGATAYRKVVAMNVTQLAGLVTTIIGAVGTGIDEDLVTISRGDSEQWRALEPTGVIDMRQDVNRMRAQLDESCLVGAIVMGDQTWTRPLHDLISQRVDITAIRALMLADQSAAFEHLIRFYREGEATHRAPANL